MQVTEAAECRIRVPFFRPSITEAEIEEVADCLRSGWLTTGPRVKRFEESFAEHVGATHAIGVSSCTAALHLAVEALDLRPGQAVLVPTMTFAATAAIVRHQGAVPILIDCDPVTLCIDLDDAERRLSEARRDGLLEVVGIIPVHVGGLMMDCDALDEFAQTHGLWIVEDAAHAFPAAWRRSPADEWRRCGEGTAAVTCFSFYSNKTITTGEGGMAVTNHPALAERMRRMSLHGLSHDAWTRYSGTGNWDYRIINPGYKYNLTDIAAGLGIHQLQRAEQMRSRREQLALAYDEGLRGIEEIELPPMMENRIHSWHLYPIRLRLDRLSIDRNEFMCQLRERGVDCSVHWRPLHLHPYYAESFDLTDDDLPAASRIWERLISLPLFPDMTPLEQQCVIDALSEVSECYSTSEPALSIGKPR